MRQSTPERMSERSTWPIGDADAGTGTLRPTDDTEPGETGGAGWTARRRRRCGTRPDLGQGLAPRAAMPGMLRGRVGVSGAGTGHPEGACG
jgi:hypothetical protein